MKISQKILDIAHTGYVHSDAKEFQNFNSSVSTEEPIACTSAILLCSASVITYRLKDNIGGTGSRPRSHLDMEDKIGSMRSSLRRENDGCPGLVLYFDGGNDLSPQFDFPTIDRL